METPAEMEKTRDLGSVKDEQKSSSFFIGRDKSFVFYQKIYYN